MRAQVFWDTGQEATRRRCGSQPRGTASNLKRPETRQGDRSGIPAGSLRSMAGKATVHPTLELKLPKSAQINCIVIKQKRDSSSVLENVISFCSYTPEWNLDYEVR